MIAPVCIWPWCCDTGTAGVAFLVTEDHSEGLSNPGGSGSWSSITQPSVSQWKQQGRFTPSSNLFNLLGQSGAFTSQDVQRYSASTDSWTAFGDASHVATFFPATGFGGKGYTAYGVMSVRETWEFTESTDSWASKSDGTVNAGAAGTNVDSLFLCTFGDTASGINFHQKFDPVADTWTDLADPGFASSVTMASSCGVDGDSLIVQRGNNSFSSAPFYGHTRRYTLSTDSWGLINTGDPYGAGGGNDVLIDGSSGGFAYYLAGLDGAGNLQNDVVGWRSVSGTLNQVTETSYPGAARGFHAFGGGA